MSGARVIFLEHAGTLHEKPPNEQIDNWHEVALLPAVIPALLNLKRAGFAFVMIADRRSAGSASAEPDRAQRFILALLASQGIQFEAEFATLQDYIGARGVDMSRSYMVGHGDSDLEFAANLGIQAFRVRAHGSDDETWTRIAERILGSARRSQIRRTTKETDVAIDVDLSREGPSSVATGLGFFDHMLEQIASHGGFAMTLRCRGDLHIDEHHTVEDCALALGCALHQALGDKRGIARYGFLLAMDEADAQVALDISGRPYFMWEGRFNRERVGDLPTELVPHFLRSFAQALGAALHVSVRGENTHHMVEACFKALGRSLRQAIRVEGNELPSTKGVM